MEALQDGLDAPCSRVRDVLFLEAVTLHIGTTTRLRYEVPCIQSGLARGFDCRGEVVVGRACQRLDERFQGVDEGARGWPCTCVGVQPVERRREGLGPDRRVDDLVSSGG